MHPFPSIGTPPKGKKNKSHTSGPTRAPTEMELEVQLMAVGPQPTAVSCNGRRRGPPPKPKKNTCPLGDALRLQHEGCKHLLDEKIGSPLVRKICDMKLALGAHRATPPTVRGHKPLVCDPGKSGPNTH